MSWCRLMPLPPYFDPGGIEPLYARAGFGLLLRRLGQLLRGRCPMYTTHSQ